MGGSEPAGSKVCHVRSSLENIFLKKKHRKKNDAVLTTCTGVMSDREQITELKLVVKLNPMWKAKLNPMWKAALRM